MTDEERKVRLPQWAPVWERAFRAYDESDRTSRNCPGCGATGEREEGSSVVMIQHRTNCTYLVWLDEQDQEDRA